MKRMKIMGLCLVAVFALAAAAASAASAAEPAFYECAKVTGGKYEKKCGSLQSGKGKGGYEIKEGIGKGKAFKGKGGAAVLYTPAIGGEVTCKSFADSGKLKSATEEEKVVSVFSGCVSLGKTCTSVQAGEKKGDITTYDLKGTLGFISKSAGTVGVDLSAESGTLLAHFECEGLDVETAGSVVGLETPTNKFTKTEESKFEVTSEHFQKYTKLEGGAEDVLETTINGSGPFPSGQKAEATNKGEELELKA